MLAMIRDHGIPSVMGWMSALARSPLFALKLLGLRVGFTLTRAVRRSIVDDDGFVIDNPDILGLVLGSDDRTRVASKRVAR